MTWGKTHIGEKKSSFENIRATLTSAFPELSDRIWNEFGPYHALEKGTQEESPEAYPIFEDVVKEMMFELLEAEPIRATVA